jgi:hypothetical protein
MALRATPTTVSHGQCVSEGPPILMRLPIGVLPRPLRARQLLVHDDDGQAARRVVIVEGTARPQRICIVSKYRGPTTT